MRRRCGRKVVWNLFAALAPTVGPSAAKNRVKSFIKQQLEAVGRRAIPLRVRVAGPAT
jgi:hypothetical protein